MNTPPVTPEAIKARADALCADCSGDVDASLAVMGIVVSTLMKAVPVAKRRETLMSWTKTLWHTMGVELKYGR